MSRATPQNRTTGLLRNRNRTAICVSSLTVALALAGCSADGSTPDAKPTAAASSKAPAASTPAASPSSPDPLAAEKAAVLTAYNNFLREQARAYEIVDWEATKVRQYAGGPVFKQVVTDVQALKSAGARSKGVQKGDSKVTKITMSGKLPTATITSCVDVTPVQVIGKDGKVIPHGGDLSRFVAVTGLEKWPHGWMLVTQTLEGRACTPRA